MLLGTADNVLTNILGVAAKKELYIYLKTVLSLEDKNIGRDPRAFHSGLSLIFGSGAASIENAILKELVSRINPKFPVEGNFVDFVEKMRTHFIMPKKG